MQMTLNKIAPAVSILHTAMYFLARAFDESPVDILGAVAGISLAIYFVLFVFRARVDWK